MSRFFQSGIIAFLFVLVHTVVTIALVETVQTDHALLSIFMALQYPGWIVFEYPMGTWALIHTGFIFFVPVVNFLIYWLAIFVVWRLLARGVPAEQVDNPN